MGAKVWGTAAVVIAAAAAAGAGIITWEGRVWDEHAQDLGFDRPAPRDYPGEKPLDQRETAALAAYTACVRPGLLLAYHTQGRVIYPGGAALDPPGSAAIAAKLSAASGYEVQNVPPESSNAGYKDWFLARFHRPGFTIEAGLGENPLELSQLPQLLLENEPLLAAALSL